MTLLDRLFPHRDPAAAAAGGGSGWTRASWIAVAIAVCVVAAVGAVVADLWTDVGESGISAAGWAAMALGVLVTLGLGVGLMSLVFISSRLGFDEPDDHQR